MAWGLISYSFAVVAAAAAAAAAATTAAVVAAAAVPPPPLTSCDIFASIMICYISLGNKSFY